ncbi:MarR family winged helix-turn-helix transcriptional regulator [Labrenzia sp. CE80]|uniref:MarR family winged helix-turn-helix transcriptional regulator n=1 Tax=Labrenzia sp. CE80 TaxID=1788986 RepID=UPI00129A9A90|nr:MarR family winged helix-turn-helix transcriptional regulator [Labrenzia sp. CE80]
MSDQAEKKSETVTGADPATASEPDQTYVLDDQIGYLLRKAYQRNAVLFSEKVQDLTPTQFAVMARLTELSSVSQNQLGRTVGLDVATTKGVIDRLLARGLVQTAPSPSDRRRQLISLTEGGWQFFMEKAQLGLQVSEETLAPLTQSEKRNLLRILRKIQ